MNRQPKLDPKTDRRIFVHGPPGMPMIGLLNPMDLKVGDRFSMYETDGTLVCESTCAEAPWVDDNGVVNFMAEAK
jgi:hypothetical protein